MADDRDADRVGRGKVRAEIKRNTAIANIKAVHTLALRVPDDPTLVPEFLSAATDLDTLWSQFKSEDDSVLDHLILLDRADEYEPSLTAEVRALIHASRVVVSQSVPKGAEAIDLSYIHRNVVTIVRRRILMKQIMTRLGRYLVCRKYRCHCSKGIIVIGLPFATGLHRW